MPNAGKHNVNTIDSFFKNRPSHANIREGETISFLEKGNLVKLEKRNGIVYETSFVEHGKKIPSSELVQTITNTTGTSDIDAVIAGTGLDGGGISGSVTINIDSTVTTLTGTQTLTNKTLTSPTLTAPVLGTPASGVMTNVTGTATNLTAGSATLASTVTVSDSTANTAFPLVFHDESNALLDDTSVFTYNPSSGTLVVGNLTVNGTTTTVDTTNTTIKDNLLELNSGASSNSNDVGIIIQRGSTGNDALLMWDESEDKWTLGTSTSSAGDTGNLNLTAGTLVAALEGNASTATTLATGRDISLTGDVTGTSQTTFNGSASVSIAATIAATSVEGSMLNDNVISGQGALGSASVAQADLFMMDDGPGTLKKVTFSNLEDSIFGNVSGDATIAAGGALTIAANSVALGTDTTGNYVATVADSGTGGITVANSGSESAAVTVELDVNGLTAETLASGDFLAFSDESATGDPTKKESIDDIATLFAGTALTASSAVINLDISGLDLIAEAALTEASDTMLVYDASASAHKRITIEDLEDAIGGTGTVTNVVAGTGLSGGGTTTATLDLDFSELTDMTGDISGSTEFILQNSTTESRKAASEIKLSNFNNDSGFVTANTMGSGFVLEDGDGTEVTITENKEVKFIDGTGMQINWTDVDNGTDADPFDLTFELDVDGLTLLNEAPADADTFILYDDSASSIKKVPASEVVGGAVSAVANGSNNRIATFSSSTALNGEANLTFDGTDLAIAATGKIYLDGGGSTYITESAGDLIDIYSGGVLMMRIEESGTDSVFTNDNVQLGVGVHKDFVMYHNGTHNYAKLANGNLYFTDESNNNILIVYREGGGIQLSEGDLKIPATSKLYFDGGSHTWISEVSDDLLEIHVGNTRMLKIEEGSDDFVYTPDNMRLAVGNAKDLQISHNATNSYIQNYTGDLYFQNHTTDGDVHFLVDDGGGNDITALKIDASENGSVFMPNDNATLGIGAGNDLRLFHDGTDSYMYNYQGELRIGNTVDDADTAFWGDNGSGGMTPYLTLDGSGGYMVASKFMIFTDGQKAEFGSSEDLQIYHNGGGNSNIDNLTGDLYVTQYKDDGDIFLRSDDGSGGVTPYLQLDGSAKYVRIPDDGIRLTLGADNDLAIFHNGTNGFIGCDTGDLIIQTTTADKDIILKSDDGSGGETAYLTLDGSDTSIQVAKNMEFADSVQANFGDRSGGDMQIYHDGSNNYINASVGHLILEQNENDHDIFLKSDNGSGGTTAYLTLDGSTTNLLLSPPSGYVGIGTSSPESYNSAGRNLVVVDSGNSGISIVAGTTSDSSIMFADGTGGTAGYRGRVAYDHNGDYLRFDTAATERVRIDSAGLVGIGTTSPGAKLDIENSTAPTLDNDTHAGEAIFLRSGGSGGDGNVQAVLAFGKADSSSRRSGSAIASVQTDSDVDKVGIGFYTSDSSASSQTMDLRMLVNHTGNLHVDADVVAFSTSVSDEKLKDNVKTISNPLDKVMALRGVEFDWNKGNRKGQKDLGLIAQEVEKVLPEIVREKKMAFIDNETYKTIDYDKVVGLLIEAIKEQQKQINKLEEKLNG